MRGRPVRLAVLGVVVLTAGWPARSEAATVFRFEDESGAVHYTNVPADPRYRPFLSTPDPPAPTVATSPESTTPAPVSWLARFAKAIRAAAQRYGVDRRLVEAIIHVESAGNPGAVSPKGAQGLMQLMPQRAADLGVQNPLDPIQNLDGGVRHLRDLLGRFDGNVTLALAAYNAGEGAVRTYQGVPPFPETREYVRKVRELYAAPDVPAAGRVASSPVAVPAPPAPAAPQQVYRQVSADGTVTFTNLPPRPEPALRRGY